MVRGGQLPHLLDGGGLQHGKDALLAEAIRRRRAKAGIPDTARHREKWRLALDMLYEVRGGWELPGLPVVADAGYGDATGFREGLTERGLAYAVAVKATTTAHPGDATPERPPYSGQGRPPVSAYPQPHTTLRALALAAGRDRTRTVTWRNVAGSRRWVGFRTAWWPSCSPVSGADPVVAERGEANSVGVDLCDGGRPDGVDLLCLQPDRCRPTHPDQLADRRSLVAARLGGTRVPVDDLVDEPLALRYLGGGRDVPQPRAHVDVERRIAREASADVRVELIRAGLGKRDLQRRIGPPAGRQVNDRVQLRDPADRSRCGRGRLRVALRSCRGRGAHEQQCRDAGEAGT
ncbi:transposase [Kitasatospora sp. GP82]|uniref:transposase n=1 Tax=Kitasatospora sp. GP82 TaxID=3035089 RepID=UPI00247567CD|nr:transposase [Kitasatospora sp. GP82]